MIYNPNPLLSLTKRPPITFPNTGLRNTCQSTNPSILGHLIAIFGLLRFRLYGLIPQSWYHFGTSAWSFHV